jgi:serine/threonine-protein kinase
MRVRVLLVVLGAVGCWVGSGSRSVRAAEPGADEQGEAERLRLGVTLREQGKDLEALDVFRQVFERGKAPKARAQMGLAEQALGRWVDAEAHLEEALAATGDPWISGNRGTLEQALGVIRDRLGSLEVLCEVPAAAAAEVVVDGQTRGKLPLERPLRVVAGTVMVQVQGKGFAAVHRHVTVLAGQLGRESFVPGADGAGGAERARLLRDGEPRSTGDRRPRRLAEAGLLRGGGGDRGARRRLHLVRPRHPPRQRPLPEGPHPRGLRRRPQPGEADQLAVRRDGGAGHLDGAGGRAGHRLVLAMKRLETLPAGTRLGKYQIVRILGAGGMGAVYEGVHVELKKQVAIKTLHPDLAVRPVARQRFLREGEAASRIRHPHVVDVTDVDAQDGTPYLVMEMLEGLDLKQHIVQHGPLPVLEVLDYLVPAIAAVAAGHDEGVIHRDLKPHNIFLARTRTSGIVPKVLDFGVSKLLDPATGGPSLTGTAAVMGTVAYMSPEQAKGAKFVDARTDQYAMALILYECLTGKRPYRGENTLAVLRQIGDGQIEPPSVHASGLPLELEKIILKGLSLRPDDRFPSLYAFGKALLTFASERLRSIWTATFDRQPSQLGLSVWSEGELEAAAGPAGERPAPAVEEPQPSPAAGAPGSPTAPGTVALRGSSGRGARPSGGAGAESTLGQSAAELAASAKPARRPTMALAAAGVAVLALGGGAWFVLGRGAPASVGPPAPAPAVAVAAPPAREPPRSLRIELAVDPREADIELDGLPVAKGQLKKEMVADGRSHALRISAPGFEPQILSFVDAPPPPSVTLRRLAAPAAASKRKSGPRRTGPAAVPQPAAPAAPAAPRVGANQAPIIKE